MAAADCNPAIQRQAEPPSSSFLGVLQGQAKLAVQPTVHQRHCSVRGHAGALA